MDKAAASEFKHTTLPSYPNRVCGLVFLDETPGFTGIYLRGPKGGLWPARTVDRAERSHHDGVLDAWRTTAIDRGWKLDDRRVVDVVDYQCSGCGRYCPDARYDFTGKEHATRSGKRCGAFRQVARPFPVGRVPPGWRYTFRK